MLLLVYYRSIVKRSNTSHEVAVKSLPASIRILPQRVRQSAASALTAVELLSTIVEEDGIGPVV